MPGNATGNPPAEDITVELTVTLPDGRALHASRTCTPDLRQAAEDDGLLIIGALAQEATFDIRLQLITARAVATTDQPANPGGRNGPVKGGARG